MILTRADGTPFSRPEKPEPGADAETVVAYLRALAAYKDAGAAYSHLEFDKAFQAALKTPRSQ